MKPIEYMNDKELKQKEDSILKFLEEMDGILDKKFIQKQKEKLEFANDIGRFGPFLEEEKENILSTF